MFLKSFFKHLAKEFLDMSNVTATFPITTIDTDTTSTITAVHYTDASGADVVLPIDAAILAKITPAVTDLVILYDDGGFSISTPEEFNAPSPVTYHAADLATLTSGTVTTASGVSIALPLSGASVTILDTDITGVFTQVA